MNGYGQRSVGRGGDEVSNKARRRDRSRLKLHPEGNAIARAAFYKGFQGLFCGEDIVKWWSERDKMVP